GRPKSKAPTEQRSARVDRQAEEAWLAVAGVRLAAGQPPDAPAVEAAVDRAHHQWGTITDAARARELGPALAELRLRVPGRRRGALENVQRHLRQLQAG
ncbi:hypothetical protein ACWCYR_34255, partial [Streptomyces sp. NPDC001494]